MTDQNHQPDDDGKTVGGPDLQPAVERLLGVLVPLLPLLGVWQQLLQSFRLLAAASMQAGPTLAGPAWKQLHDSCSAALGLEVSGAATAVAGRPAMSVPRFPNPPPPAANGAVAVWPGQGSRGDAAPGESAPVLTVSIADVRKRDDVARELERVTAALHSGAAPVPKG